MRLTSIDLHRVYLPLVSPFRTSFGTQDVRDTVLIRVTTDDAEGWGEVVTVPWPLYSSEHTDAIIPLVRDHLGPRLLAASRELDGDLLPADVGRALAPVVGHRMAKAALEAAVLDAWLRGRDLSYADLLGVRRDRIPCGVSVGITETVDDLVRTVEGYLDEGYVRIKLKIEPGFDVDAVAAVRAAIGDDVPLQVDANTAYEPGDVRTLRALDAFDLSRIDETWQIEQWGEDDEAMDVVARRRADADAIGQLFAAIAR